MLTRRGAPFLPCQIPCLICHIPVLWFLVCPACRLQAIRRAGSILKDQLSVFMDLQGEAQQGISAGETQVDPLLLLAVGRVAAQNLLGVTTPIGKLRNRDHVHAETNKPVMVTYHPAYLLRSPLEKRKAYADLCAVRRRLDALA